MRTATITVRGRVQGVGFRYALQAEAERRGAVGWVRNRHDGSVEALVAGSPEAVDTVLEWARRGPAAARVDRIEVGDGPADAADSSTFEIRPTA